MCNCKRIVFAWDGQIGHDLQINGIHKQRQFLVLFAIEKGNRCYKESKREDFRK